jgi:hypothetical protein
LVFFHDQIDKTNEIENNIQNVSVKILSKINL